LSDFISFLVQNYLDIGAFSGLYYKYENGFHFHIGGNSLENIRDYKTKQRETILEILKAQSDRHMTVKDIMEELRSKSVNVGQTTVYRYLDKLVSSGELRKYQAHDGLSTCYQYIGAGDCHNHYHFMCVNCGELTHLECKHIDSLANHVFDEHEFTVDCFKTVFYGVCKNCNGEMK